MRPDVREKREVGPLPVSAGTAGENAAASNSILDCAKMFGHNARQPSADSQAYRTQEPEGHQQAAVISATEAVRPAKCRRDPRPSKNPPRGGGPKSFCGWAAIDGTHQPRYNV